MSGFRIRGLLWWSLEVSLSVPAGSFRCSFLVLVVFLAIGVFAIVVVVAELLHFLSWCWGLLCFREFSFKVFDLLVRFVDFLVDFRQILGSDDFT